MSGISTARVITGGLAAGLVINVIEFLVNGLWLAKDWEDAMRALGKPAAQGSAQVAMFLAWGFVMGLLAVWTYAAMRPRFGPGSKTAAIAAVAVWLSGYVLSMVPPVVMELLPASLMLTGVGVGLVEIVVATQVGAYLYREP